MLEFGLDYQRRVDALLATALEKNGDITDWLDAECGNDNALKTRILTLVEASRREHSFFDTISVTRQNFMKNALEDDTPPLVRGDTLGVFRVEEKIGEGGLAYVYKGERNDERFKQTVALKVMRRAFRSPAHIDDFFRERQILSRLEHPGIARVIDGGETEDGAPWLAMEYVNGVPISEYCRDNDLSVTEIIALILQVTEALSFAHKRLVIHQDLKPSNVLVDGSERIKLLDFGVAKLIQDRAENEAAAQILAITPEYAAPEQFAGAENVTVETDVYLIGGLLRELLTGQTPNQTSGRISVIKPSNQVSNNSRKSKLAGDLDSIICKAQSEAASERYASVDVLQEDLKRHLKKLPLSISTRPNRDYIRSFLRRNPFGMGAFAAVAIAIMGWAVSAQYLNGLYKNQKQVAEAEAQRATAVTTAMMEVFKRADNMSAEEPLSENKSPWDYLSFVSGDIEAEVAGDDETLAELLSWTATLHQRSGQYDQVLEKVEKRQSILANILSENNPEKLLTDAKLLYWQADPRTSISLAGESIKKQADLIQTALSDLEVSDIRLLVHKQLGDTLKIAGFHSDAKNNYEFILKNSQILSSKNEDLLLSVEESLSETEKFLGNFDNALRYAHASVDRAAKMFGADHRKNVSPLIRLGNILDERGEAENAIEVLEKALEIEQRYYQGNDGQLGFIMNNLANAYATAGHHKDAIDMFEQLMKHLNNQGLSQSDHMRSVIQNVGIVYEKAKELDNAEAAYRKAGDLGKTLPDTDFLKYIHLISLSRVHVQKGDFIVALKTVRNAKEKLTPVLPEGHYVFSMLDCYSGQSMALLGLNNAGEFLLSGSNGLKGIPGREVEYEACIKSLNDHQTSNASIK